MTPQEAFECAARLYGAEHLCRHDNPRILFFSVGGHRSVVAPMLASPIDWPKGVEQWPLPQKEWVHVPPNAWKDFHGQAVRTPDGRLGELVGKNNTGFMILVKGEDDEETIVICKGCEVQK